MNHSTDMIAGHARSLVAQYGSRAQEVALERMMDRMQHDDVVQATMWMSVAHAIEAAVNGDDHNTTPDVS